MITEKMIEAGARAIVGDERYDALPERATYMQRKSNAGAEWWDREELRDTARTALEAAERAAWKPIEEADQEREYLLYYPEKVTGAHKQAKLPARVVVGYPGDSPNRPPTHFRPLPSPPEAPKGEE